MNLFRYKYFSKFQLEDPIQGFNNGNNGEHVGASTALPSFMTSLGIDYNHPLFLSLSDVSGYNLLLFQLLGTENYTLWSITITVRTK